MACEEIKARLDAANAAYDRLARGEQVVIIVDAFRSRVEYKPSNLSELFSAIQLMQVEYDRCINPTQRPIATTPVRFSF